MKSQWYRKPLSVLLSIAMVLSLIPSQALAEALEEVGSAAVEVTEGDGNVLAGQPDDSGDADATDGDEADPEDAGDPDEATDSDSQPDQDDPADANGDDDTDAADLLAAPDDSDDLIGATAADDPFFFVDVETGQRTTTLHTSGSYQLVNPDGSPYTEGYPSAFVLVGTNPRESAYQYSASPKYVDSEGPDDETTREMVVIEDLTDSDWQLPSARYRVQYSKSSSWNPVYLTQTYRIINDGLFMSYFDFSGRGRKSENNYQFSVKPYTEGKTDDDYDGYRDEYGFWHSEDDVDEQEPFALASDTRLKFAIESAKVFDEDTQPQIESISLWKADESLETLVGTYDDQDEEQRHRGKYVELSRTRISRIPQILAESGLTELPTWPTYLNFNDDSKLTTLWERGDESLNERILISEFDDSPTYATVIIDQANFAGTVAEDGLYFPIVKATIGGESYTYAYFPIEVSAAETSPRNDPIITTTSLKKARANDAYTATLKGKSGMTDEARAAAAQAGTYACTWAVTDGALPAGLTLNATTGTISGTPTELGTWTFAVTLAETANGDARTATRQLTLVVREPIVPETAIDQLSLGEISYKHGTIWLSHVYNRPDYLDLRIPISLDIREERYNLGETELHYLVKMQIKNQEQPDYYEWSERVADLISEDGTTLEIGLPLDTHYGSPRAILRIDAYLVPKDNDGNYAFDRGEVVNLGTMSDGEPYDILPVEYILNERYGGEPDDPFVSGAILTAEDKDSRNLSFRYGAWVGDFSYYINPPEMPHARLENPDVNFGSWIRFPNLSFEGDDIGEWPTVNGRVRIWPYDGTTTPTQQQVAYVSPYAKNPGEYGYVAAEDTATLKLAPGTYAFVVEGEIPVYDDAGAPIDGATAWVDIAGKVRGARAIKGTSPRQYVFTLEPNEGSEGWAYSTFYQPHPMDVTYTSEYMNVDMHTLVPTFELENGSFVSSRDAGLTGSVNYNVSWYRRTGDPDDASTDVLVATGDTVMFGSNDYPLYVELTPTGRDASFWKFTGKVLVSEKNRIVSLQVPRKLLFDGTFNLSCASGKTPDEGETWGIIEVQTPLANGSYASSNLWASEGTVVVPNITSGSIITYTPAWGLGGTEVSYTVPEDASTSFSQDLEAPLPKGVVSFQGLSFVDANGETHEFALDDGQTELRLDRLHFDREGNELDYTDSQGFYVIDGSTIALEPISGTFYSFEQDNEDAVYRITLVHRDGSVDESFGAESDDVAARQTFDVTLSKTKTSATVPAATLTSRGYATVTLVSSDETAGLCTLLLYKADGANGTLVDKGPASSDTQVRTPFLDAGDYRLYAVDSALLRYASNYKNETNLANLLMGNLSHGTRTSFSIADGAVTEVPDALIIPSWQVTEPIDRTNSSVTATASYSDKVSIQMHAEIAKGASVSDSAYLEVVTNQASGVGFEGYMAPKALTINGRPITLNRWNNLFNQTQNMSNGNLTILLSEAKKTDEICGSFPMDLTLVIPRMNMSITEVSVWLVDRDGNNNVRRYLVGSDRKEVHEASIHAPGIVAWDTFYVTGETGPRATVTIRMNGMKAATTTADEYGYYETTVSLPEDVEDFDEFTLSAAAHWWRGDSIYTATSKTIDVTYSTSFPTIERITMCWQSVPGGSYDSIVTYDRGRQPERYKTIYRAENENNSKPGDDHAKDFWLIEYANGELATNVQVTIPRSGGAIQCQVTDDLKTAESWIPDVRDSTATEDNFGSYGWWYMSAGDKVRSSLASDTLHSFVTKPVYLTYGASELEITFDLLEEEFEPLEMGTASDLGRFDGFRAEGVDADELAQLFDAMAEMGYLRVCSSADAAGLAAGEDVDVSALASSADMAQALVDAEAGSVDEWLLVGVADESEEGEDPRNMLLKVHHQVSTTELGTEGVRAEIQGLLDEALPVANRVVEWVEADDGSAPPKVRYHGDLVMVAGNARYLENDSRLYYIVTVDDDCNAKVEMLEQYRIESDEDGADDEADDEGTQADYLYLFTYQDKYQMVRTSYNERTGQKVVVTKALAQDQVDEAEVASFEDVFMQWMAVDYAIDSAIGLAVQELYGGEEEGDNDDGPLGAIEVSDDVDAVDSDDAPEDDLLGAVEDTDDELLGIVGSAGGEFVGFNKVYWARQLLDKWFPYEGAEGVAKTIATSHDDDHDPTSLSEKALTNQRFSGKEFQGTLETAGRYIAEDAGLTAASVILPPPIGSGSASVSSYVAAGASPALTGVFDRIFKGTPINSPSWDYIKANWLGRDDAYEAKKKKEAALEKLKKQCKKDFKDLMNYKYAHDHEDDPRMKKRYRKRIQQKRKAMHAKYPASVIKQTQAEYQAEEARLKAAIAEQNRKGSDPSGVVYEAVLSNPVEGAVVQLYTFNPMAANAGLDPAQFTDSTQFGIEENPQTTGEDGRYQWFVPEGWWQVRVTKQGYEPFSTGDARWGHEEELPIYEKQTVAKTDDEGNPLYDDGGNPIMVEVSLPKADASGNPIMQTTWVGDYGIGASKTLTYTNASGEEVSVESDSYWMPVLPEQLDVNIPLVSYEEPYVLSTEADGAGLTVTFSKYMKVDTVCAGDFTLGGVAATSIEPLNAEAAADGSVDGEGNPVMLASRFRIAYPAGMELDDDDRTFELDFDAASGPQSYAGVVSRASETDEVAIILEPAERPIATIAGKSYGVEEDMEYARNVDAGSELVLTSATEGATIYYTTDGSDPSKDSTARQAYTEPIELTDDVNFRIVAYKDGMEYSEELRLVVWMRVAYFAAWTCDTDQQGGEGGSFDIVYLAVDGNVLDDSEVDCRGFEDYVNTGTTVALTAKADDGYEFVGWYQGNYSCLYDQNEDCYYPEQLISSDATYRLRPGFSIEDGVEVTSDVMPCLCAVFEHKVTTHTVRFDANGGTGKMDPATVEHGKTYKLPACNFTRKGYCFTGWDKGAVGSKITVNGDVVVKAKWVKSTWERIWGQNGYDTMKAIVGAESPKAFADGRGGTVVVASRSGWEDPLAGTALAGYYDAPLLLVGGPKDKLPEQTKSELGRLKPKQIIVVGGTDVVPASTFNAIKSATKTNPTMKRIEGKTYLERANNMFSKTGAWKSKTVIISTHNSFRDTLSVSPLAYKEAFPIVFVGTKLSSKEGGKLADSTLSVLKSKGVKNVIIVGGKAAVSGQVEDQLAKKVGVAKTNVKRWYGTDSLDTSAAIAKKAMDEYGMTVEHISVARNDGNNYVDALAGAALTGKLNGVLVLVNGTETDVNKGAKAFNAIKSRIPGRLIHGHVYGGTSAINTKYWNHISKTV